MSSETLRNRLGRIGIWSFRFEQLDPFDAAHAAGEVERLGFPSLWVPEVGGTEALSLAAHLLASTSELVIANGIARISDRSASAAAAAHRYLDGLSDGRHVLGLGLGAKLSGEPNPLNIMSTYVDDFTAAWNAHPDAAGTSPCLCLAAYNENMALLAGERSDGIHTYLVNPAHTINTRKAVGFDPVIAAEVPVVLTEDRDHARAVGRAHLANYLGSRSHQRKFSALGFSESDWADGGSNALVDSLIVHGDSAIVDCIRKHLGGGADHVGVQVLGTSSLEEDLAGWTRLSELLASAAPRS